MFRGRRHPLRLRRQVMLRRRVTHGSCRTRPSLILFGFLLFLIIILFSIPVHSRTWHIKHDGTGDAPTIQAGVDSAVVGDSVIVGPGIYEESIQMDKGLILISEKGPFRTRIVPEPGTTPPYAIIGLNLSFHRTEINGFWIEGFVWGTSGAISFMESRLTKVANNVLANNRIGISLYSGSAVMSNNTFYGNSEYAIDGRETGSGIVEYCIIWDRAVGLDRILAAYNDFLILSDQGPNNTMNFSQDPEFCGAEAGNLFLQSDSPCAPGNSPWPAIGLIGALPVSCGTTSTQNLSWGELKIIYSE